MAITSDGRALAGRSCATTSLSQFPHALCSTFGAVASLRHKPPALDTCWLGGWPSQVPLPFSVLPTYPVPSRISGDKPCTLGAHPCSMSPRLLSHGLHAPLSKWLWLALPPAKQALKGHISSSLQSLFLSGKNMTTLSSTHTHNIIK